ncbi:Sua5/YciO/YrdC/YwlC family protein [Chloroherpeton thalassium ATCC 35110]|uniref:Threonylcarbamoyl-AMP synthase n=1 Tax=Chloroherpeton thalassium (strain ATCC 35110 / GB-78) TaxID=517418 RepID=B3QU83_CHLT3|nr:L-threonylcarbamoyladenylate synthase [Chloroherpeton thalassium]ACF14332.1 Sua5/YciO/YrdC/YwlC family protein [Chloroherpeton thalassium ATCC 35110]
MTTKVTASTKEAARFLLKDELVAFPTETVYGLGANIFSEEAVHKIFRVKGRPAQNPLIAHISNLTELILLVKRVTASAEKLIDAFFPGPLTLVLPKSKYVPYVVTSGLDTIGVRMPSHQVAQAFLKACGVSVAAPSANLSGRPSPTTWQNVEADLDGLISCILKGGRSEVGLESTIVDCTGKAPVLLRAGAITLEQLQEITPAIKLAEISDDEPARCPGTKYKHYAPDAKVVLIDAPSEIHPEPSSAYIGIEQPEASADSLITCSCVSIEEYAHQLFHFFRECDKKQVRTIFCQRVAKTGLGLALMDRLTRAAMK